MAALFRLKLFIFAAFFGLFCISHATEQTFVPVETISYAAVLGDSITENGGYIRELKRLCPDVIFHNYGISSQTSGQILNRVRLYDGDRLKKILALYDYDYLIVLAGVNNVEAPEKVIRDLSKIYAKAKSIQGKDITVIALTLTPWGGYQTWTPTKQRNTELINSFILSYPQHVDHVVDIYTPLLINEESNMMNPQYCTGNDRLHPGRIGQIVIGREIYRSVFSTVPYTKTENK